MKSYLILASFLLAMVSPGQPSLAPVMQKSMGMTSVDTLVHVETDVNARRPSKARRVTKVKTTARSRQTITAGKPIGAKLPIVQSKNKNVVGKQKKLYRGVRNINGISGGQPDKYVDDTFKNGIVSNYQLPINKPGIKVPNKGPRTDILAHQKSAENSIFISTSSSKKVAKGFASSGKGSGVFVIKPKESQPIDVNKTLGEHGIPEYKNEKEFAIPNKVYGHEITKFVTYDKNGKKISEKKNPYLDK